MVRSPVFFHQHCPVCGRIVRVRVSLLGRQVYCQHCQGRFVAADPSMTESGPTAGEAVVDDLIQRANSLLARSDSMSFSEEVHETAVTVVSRTVR